MGITSDGTLSVSKRRTSGNRTAQVREFTQEAISAYDADQLGLQPYARALARTLTSMKRGTVVAVLGEWGQGKTSFLNMVSSYITADTDISGSRMKTVEVPLWKYEKVSDIAYAIARDTKEQTISTGGRVQRGLAIYGKRSLNTLSTLLRSVKIKPPWLPVEFSVSDSPEEFQERTKAIDYEHFVYREMFEKCVRFFIESTSPESGEDVVVFIDDIDRVEPETALGLLENIKMLLANASCRFVLALDHGVLRHAVTARYGRLGYQDPDQYAFNYLDKLIDLTVCLPRLSIEGAETFLNRLTREFPEHAALTPAERCVLLAGVPLNPRAIKRLVAALYHEKQVDAEFRKDSRGRRPNKRSRQAGEDGRTHAIVQAKRVKRLILQLFYPSIVDWALASPERFSAMQGISGTEGKEWLPEAVSAQKARMTSAELLSRAERTLTSESEKKVVAWATKYCPQIWGFLRHTPRIDASDFSLASPTGRQV